MTPTGRVDSMNAFLYFLPVPYSSGPSFTTHPALPADPLSAYLADLRFVVNRFGHQHDDPSAEADPRVIGDVELIYFRGGSGRIVSSGSDFTCGRGDIVIIPPFHVHEIRTTAADPHDNYWVHFDVAPLYERERFVSLLSSRGPHIKAADADPLTARALGLVASAVDRAVDLAGSVPGRARFPGGAPGTNAVIEAAIRVLAVAIGSPGDLASILPRTIPSRDERSVLDRVLAWVAANLDAAIAVEDLVDVAACSRSLLFRVFQERLGRSPMGMVRWMRLREAELLLRSTSRSVKEISAAVGISSPFHLSRLVKELYGVSPQQLRTRGHAEWTP
jgi:AraC-like DNA-binding protein